MNHKWLASTLLIASLVSVAFAQDDWSKYQPRTLKEVVSMGEASFKNPDFTLTEKGRVVMVLSRDTFPSLVKVTYTGQSRPVSAAKKEVIAAWLRVYKPQNQEYLKLFADELLFTDGKEEYWLPTQSQVIPYFAKELTKGDSVSLYLVWVGGRLDSGKIEHVFLVNEFEQAAPPDPGH